MKKLFFIFVLLLATGSLFARNQLVAEAGDNDFALATSQKPTVIFIDKNDDWLVHKSAELLQQDLEMVTGRKPAIVYENPGANAHVIIIGTITRSGLLQKLQESKKQDQSKLQNQWEAFQVAVVKNPFEGIDEALVIAGSDKRGTAFGVFEISKLIGVSPWYWWADVPVKKKKEIFLRRDLRINDQPKVKYRGIFINDEAPAFSGWTHEKFGGFNHRMYEKVFELLLRLKANYLWPAMWGNAFNDDDSLNRILADKYGIVMGTSHHEPMLRAQQEWKRYGKGDWNYQTNKTGLDSFWRKGMENMDSHESIVTIGMRGDGDEPMTTGTATKLLEEIVADQRKIIADVTGKPASETPQLWALYKEVQDYYDKGMRVPDDVTLLLCDDNWGNIRRLPRPTDRQRAGGYGIYYHFDYVGGPRNYKWINTNNIARVWEQMHLAYSYGVDRIWIVNVGDLKPMELPITFFLDYAWNPEKITAENVGNYYADWAGKQFGQSYAKEIGDILQKYSQYIARRKPELLSPKTYSLHNYDEADRVLSEYRKLLKEAESINTKLPEDYKDAYFQLVLFPVKAFENINQLYVAVAKNHWLAEKKNMAANTYADAAKAYFEKDSLLSYQYNHVLANGKWNHMMDQTHIGYTYWQQPPYNKMPEVIYVLENSQQDESIKIDVKDKTAENLIPQNANGNIFYEKNGYVSINTANFSSKKESGNVQWKIIPGIGKDGDGITTFPVTKEIKPFRGNSPFLEYHIYVYDSGMVRLNTHFSPTLNFEHDTAGLQYAVSVDDEKPQIVSVNKEDNIERTWEKWVANNIVIKSTEHKIPTPGKHIVRYWIISPALILQKITLDFGGLQETYLGPPQTILKEK